VKDWSAHTAYAVPEGSGSCMLELQPASQPAGIGLLPIVTPTGPSPEVTAAKA